MEHIDERVRLAGDTRHQQEGSGPVLGVGGGSGDTAAMVQHILTRVRLETGEAPDLPESIDGLKEELGKAARESQEACVALTSAIDIYLAKVNRMVAIHKQLRVLQMEQRDNLLRKVLHKQ